MTLSARADVPSTRSSPVSCFALLATVLLAGLPVPAQADSALHRRLRPLDGVRLGFRALGRRLVGRRWILRLHGEQRRDRERCRSRTLPSRPAPRYPRPTSPCVPPSSCRRRTHVLLLDRGAGCSPTARPTGAGPGSTPTAGCTAQVVRVSGGSERMLGVSLATDGLGRPAGDRRAPGHRHQPGGRQEQVLRSPAATRPTGRSTSSDSASARIGPPARSACTPTTRGGATDDASHDGLLGLGGERDVGTVPPATPSTPTQRRAASGSHGSAAVGTTAYAVPSGAVFVATSGNDANAGTSTSPVRTVTKALTKVQGVARS